MKCLKSNACLDPQYEEEVSGCTACCSLITGEKIYIVRITVPYWSMLIANSCH